MPKALPTSQTILPVIIDKGIVFIDKTRFIPIYEESQSLVSLFLRPRRFGKTMFTEILKYYYDSALEEQSTRIFRDTHIAANPTPLKSSLLVLMFDFSGIDTRGGAEAVLDSFTHKIICGIDDFYFRYPGLIPAEIRCMAASSQPNELSWTVCQYYSNKTLFPTAGRLINHFMNYMKNFQKKLMVIIDEYDNFTNDILSHDANAFAEIARKEGDVSRFYQNLRACQQRGIIDRIFITGVLPVTLDTSLTGFVFDRLYDDHQFNELAGFTGDEIRTLLHETVDFGQCAFTPETLAEEIRKRYNGYRFAENAENTVCNPALCLGFLKQLTNRKGQKIPPLGTESGNDMDFKNSPATWLSSKRML